MKYSFELEGINSQNKRFPIDILLLESTEDIKDPGVNYFSQIPYDKTTFANPVILAKKDNKKKSFSKRNFSLYVTNFEIETLKNLSKIRMKGSQHIETDLKKIIQSFKSLNKNKKEIVVGFNKSLLPINFYSYYKSAINSIIKDSGLKFKTHFVDISQALEELYLTKTKKEIEIIKEGAKLSDKIIRKTLNQLKTCKNEQDIHNILHTQVLHKSLTYSFTPIIASGKSSAEPHYSDRKKLRKGFCFLDFGIRYKGYCTDTTRTLYIGTPNKKEIEIYNKVLNVQKECIKMIRPGIDLRAIDYYVFENFSDEYLHCTGHSLGVHIHESPCYSFASETKEIAKEGMVLTVEPGVYYKDKFGIRIEDMVLVTKDGCEVLTKTSKDLKIIN